MKLTDKDYKNIAEMVTDGHNSIEYEKGGETLYIDCTLETDGYEEDDYFHGTGAWVETSRDLTVESFVSYDDDGEKTENDFEEGRLQKAVA